MAFFIGDLYVCDCGAKLTKLTPSALKRHAATERHATMLAFRRDREGPEFPAPSGQKGAPQ